MRVLDDWTASIASYINERTQLVELEMLKMDKEMYQSGICIVFNIQSPDLRHHVRDSLDDISTRLEVSSLYMEYGATSKGASQKGRGASDNRLSGWMAVAGVTLWLGPCSLVMVLDNPQNRPNWSSRKRWRTTVLISLFMTVSPISSLLVAPASNAISSDSVCVSNLGDPIGSSSWLSGHHEKYQLIDCKISERIRSVSLSQGDFCTMKKTVKLRRET